MFDFGADGLVPRAFAPIGYRLTSNLGVGTVPVVAVTPDGKRVLGVDPPASRVLVFDVEPEALHSISLGASPFHVAVSADSKRAVALSTGIVHLIDMDDVPQRIRTVSVPNLSRFAAAFDGVQGGFWVSQQSDRLRALRLHQDTGAVLETLDLGPYGLIHQLSWTPQTGLAAAVTGSFFCDAGSPNSLATVGRLIT